jgi:hypothetical protein
LAGKRPRSVLGIMDYSSIFTIRKVAKLTTIMVADKKLEVFSFVNKIPVQSILKLAQQIYEKILAMKAAPIRSEPVPDNPCTVAFCKRINP